MGEAESPPEQWVPGYLPRLFTDSAPTEVVARDLHARIPGSRLVVLAGVGHQLDMEAPNRFNAEVRGFLRSVQR